MSYPTLTSKPGALETAQSIRNGELTPLEAVEEAISRIERLDVHINSVVVCDFERAVETAKGMMISKTDKQPLFGVPMTIKESFNIKGLPTCWGHSKYADNIARQDAKIVAKLKAAGVIFLGKTNVPVDLSDWQSFNEVYGRTKNPHDLSRSPGGSSGGSAAAVASGMVPIEYGTDIGGSVRVPAHFCGVWGHKTSWGLVSKHGHDHPAMGDKDAHDGALSIAGPLARNADDIDILLRLTCEFPLKQRRMNLKDCRILAILDHPNGPIDDSVANPIESCLKTLDKHGIKIDRASSLIPDLVKQQADYIRMLNIAMARGAPSPDGKRATATDWFNLLDKQTQNELAWEQVFKTYDLVLAPPAPVLAIHHNEEAVFRGSLRINDVLHHGSTGLAWAGLATFPNLPATCLPIGQTDGLPCGLQVMGPRWSDLDCVAAAKQIAEILKG